MLPFPESNWADGELFFRLIRRWGSLVANIRLPTVLFLWASRSGNFPEQMFHHTSFDMYSPYAFTLQDHRPLHLVVKRLPRKATFRGIKKTRYASPRHKAVRKTNKNAQSRKSVPVSCSVSPLDCINLCSRSPCVEVEDEYGSMTTFAQQIIERCGSLAELGGPETPTYSPDEPESHQESVPLSCTVSFPPFSCSVDFSDVECCEYGSMVPFINDETANTRVMSW